MQSNAVGFRTLLMMIAVIGGLLFSSKQHLNAEPEKMYYTKSTEIPHPSWVNLDASIKEIKREGQISIFEINHNQGKEGSGAVGRFVICNLILIADQRGYGSLTNLSLADNKMLVVFLKNQNDDVSQIMKGRYAEYNLSQEEPIKDNEMELLKKYMCGIKNRQFRIYNEEATSKAESNAEPYYNRGLDYLRKSQYDEAIIELNKAIEIYPRYANAYSDRGYAYMQKRQFDRAISDFTKTLDINPQHHYAHTNRGLAYFKKSQYDKAISEFNKAIEINPKIGETYYYRGLAYFNIGKNDRAIADYNYAIKLNPTYAEAYINRAWFYYYFHKDYDRAWEDVQKAQSLGFQVPPKFLNDLRKDSGREN